MMVFKSVFSPLHTLARAFMRFILGKQEVLQSLMYCLHMREGPSSTRPRNLCCVEKGDCASQVWLRDGKDVVTGETCEA